MKTVCEKQRASRGMPRVVTALSVAGLAALSACASQPVVRTPVAGSSVNQWSIYIQEASNRFSIPQSWIRAVMQQESGGHQYIRGRKVRSVHGAVGLMQIKPATYYELAQRYSLGSDPYDPHDNIMAGSGYIRELYDRFGSPQFLAAYNCGPQCAENHRTRGTALPDYAKTYMAAIKPHLNDPVPAMLQPTQIAYAPAPAPPVKVVAETSVPASAPHYAAGTAPPLPDDSIAAPTPYNGADGAIAVSSADTPTPATDYVQPASTAPAYAAPAAAAIWRQDNAATYAASIQIGAFSTQDRALRATALARQSSTALANAVSQIDLISPAGAAHPVWRTRLAGLPPEQTSTICTSLRQQGMPCVPVTNP
ncbi:lytic transglycosylase domain-containing protein [Acetobacter sp.]|uniref:lytic transglycosylase domain-containing protein n=1 Tax=Acetobacter sp. TaxID=440 RepID=UPI0039ED6BEE